MALSKDKLKKEDLQEIRVILIGKTGAGKSYLGNALLGREEFHTSVMATSDTTSCACGKQEITSSSRKYILKVIDTPGIKDNRVPEAETCAEMLKCLALTLPGPHLFVIVVQIGRFTEEELTVVELLKREFGDELMNFALVVFTNGSKLKGMPIETFLETAPPALQQVVRESHNRYAVIYDDDINLQDSVQNIIDLIVNSANVRDYYTNDIFKKANENKKKIVASIEEKLKRKITALEKDIKELRGKEKERCTEEEKGQIKEEKQRKEEELKIIKTNSSEEIYDKGVISGNYVALKTFVVSASLGGLIALGVGFLILNPVVFAAGFAISAVLIELITEDL